MLRTDDLGINGLKLIQDTDLFCFGTDSVLLSNFAKAKKGQTVVDLCSGNGIIPILMSAKCNPEKFYGIELQKPSFELAKKNIELNGLGNKMEMFCDDIDNVSKYFAHGSVDTVTCNPPYMSNAGFTNPDDAIAAARHEIKTNLEAVVMAAASILKFGGHFYMVHRAERICDVFLSFRQNKIEPKRLTFISPSPDKAPNLIMIDGMYGAKPPLKIEKSIYVNIL